MKNYDSIEIMIKNKKQSLGMENFLMHMGGKWKPILLWNIHLGINRFGLLEKALPKITKQMLSQQLKDLESQKMVNRKIYAEIPPRVEYTLTKLGTSLIPVLNAMQHWGEEQLAKHEVLSLF